MRVVHGTNIPSAHLRSSLAALLVIAMVQAGCGTADQAEATTDVANVSATTPQRFYKIVPTYGSSTYAGQTTYYVNGYQAVYLREADTNSDGVKEPITCADLAATPPADVEKFTVGLSGFVPNYPGSTSGSAATFESQCQQLGQYVFQKRTWDPSKAYLAKNNVYRSVNPNPADPRMCYKPKAQTDTVAVWTTQCGYKSVCVSVPNSYGGGYHQECHNEQYFPKACAVSSDLADKPFVKAPQQDFAGLVQKILYQMPGGQSVNVSSTRTAGGAVHELTHSDTTTIKGSMGFNLGVVQIGGSGGATSGWSTSTKQEQLWGTTWTEAWPPARLNAGPDVPNHNNDVMAVITNAEIGVYGACPAASGVNPLTEDFGGLNLIPAAQAPWADPSNTFDPERFSVDQLVNPCIVTQAYSRLPDADVSKVNVSKEAYFFVTKPTSAWKDGNGDIVCDGVKRFPPESLKRIWALDPFLDDNGKQIQEPNLMNSRFVGANGKYRFVPIQAPMQGPCAGPYSAGTCNAINFDENTPKVTVAVDASNAINYMKSYSDGYSYGASASIFGNGISGERKVTWTTSTEDQAMLSYQNAVTIDWETPYGVCGSGTVYLDSLAWALLIPAHMSYCSTGEPLAP